LSCFINHRQWKNDFKKGLAGADEGQRENNLGFLPRRPPSTAGLTQRVSASTASTQNAVENGPYKLKIRPRNTSARGRAKNWSGFCQRIGAAPAPVLAALALGLPAALAVALARLCLQRTGLRTWGFVSRCGCWSLGWLSLRRRRRHLIRLQPPRFAPLSSVGTRCSTRHRRRAK